MRSYFGVNEIISIVQRKHIVQNLALKKKSATIAITKGSQTLMCPQRYTRREFELSLRCRAI